MTPNQNPNTSFFSADTCDLNDFKALTAQTCEANAVPNACEINQNVPIYDMAALRSALENPVERKALLAEWASVFLSGSGALVLRAAYAQTDVIDEATATYEAIIAAEKQSSAGCSDHFAASGANDRIWNSLQKLCEQAPEVFLRYFANTSIAAACEAWLGPNYQMTTQVNLVHPDGAAQLAHRDYHLGFQTAEISAAYPAHVHDLSPALTLQGAVAHCDMPIQSGPTKLLPFSQMYREGYVAWRRDDFRAYFEKTHVQLPLKKGDALFFNPAIFHAAGANTSSNIHRMANLLQISSAFGRAMETVDRKKMSVMLYPFAQRALQEKTLTQSELSAAIAACAEGYSFPTNLDRDPPKGGLAPKTQQACFAGALEDGASVEQFSAQLNEIAENQKP